MTIQRSREWREVRRAILGEGTETGDEEDMTDPIDINGPWWKASRLPTLDSHYSTGWASIGISIMALHGGPPVLEKQYTASLKDDDTVEAFRVRYEAAFPGLRPLNYDRAANRRQETQLHYIADHGAVCINHDGDVKVDVHAVSRDPAFMAETQKFIAENTTTSIPRGRVHVLISTSDGPEFKSMGIGGQTLERGNYEDDVLKGFDRIIADLGSSTPAGRVAILDGKPGTGKTFLVRGLLDQVKDVIFVIVPANLVQELGQPGMIPALVSLHQSRGEKPMVFLIEDADECLAPRMGDNMSSVSVILNLGDGILGQLLDVRIVATTNAHHQDVDEAIKRPGRLSAMVHVGLVSPEKAAEIYKRLTGNDAVIYPDLGEPLHARPMFTSRVSLAEIYQMARDKGWTPPPKERKLGFGSRYEDDDED